ncbi:MAG: hypothetical protein M1832_004794 [Thelocarpon impressellum]|nr:MAG: hypothetical protein M1832_004794 [Thelocarpon impressellum]
MKFLSNALMSIGGILLAHAFVSLPPPRRPMSSSLEQSTRLTEGRCYSAHEHSSQAPTTPLSPASPSPSESTPYTATSTPGLATAPLPLDIVLETLVSVLLVCLGLVLASPPLRPTSWRVWAGRLEREKVKAGERTAGNPFRALEERVGFWDVRAKRREFDEWVREKGTAVET